MRKVPEIPFPLSVWPHAVMQAVMVIFAVILGEKAMGSGISQRVDQVSAITNGMSGWYLLAIAWLVHVFLLGEVVVRRSQNLASAMFPKQPWGFHILTGISVVLAWYALFVLMECVLFRVAIGTYPLETEKVPFYQGFAHTFIAHAPMMLVIVAGEILRQGIYRKRMHRWLQERTLQRLKPATEIDEDRY
jgi:hypothetical protein